MRRRRFGSSDVTASEIGFGAWAVGSGWWGPTDEPEALVDRALELGITFFDTGDAYGDGLGERLLGRALGRVDRSAFELATKFGYVLDAPRDGHAEGERPQDWSPAHVRRALEASLRRLGTDYVDLYQLHNPRMDAIERDDLFDELERLRAAGTIRAYGVALGPAIGWREEGLRLLDGVPRVERLRFLEAGGRRTLTAAAVQFILGRPQIATILPTIASVADLEEYAAAAAAPPLTEDELERIDAALGASGLAA